MWESGAVLYAATEFESHFSVRGSDMIVRRPQPILVCLWKLELFIHSFRDKLTFAMNVILVAVEIQDSQQPSISSQSQSVDDDDDCYNKIHHYKEFVSELLLAYQALSCNMSLKVGNAYECRRRDHEGADRYLPCGRGPAAARTVDRSCEGTAALTGSSLTTYYGLDYEEQITVYV
ncbi:hypothetical protein EVAR_87611_1 [Eumeta japonica]|uniref:Uncharacterized protein n=1 Tax=Eumeta variegata TaxID=151549 RepID=A0A4C1WLN5_EUMVA|nr:hypothetical protein EVAR_87611_1 [Eumeta japonica]